MENFIFIYVCSALQFDIEFQLAVCFDLTLISTFLSTYNKLLFVYSIIHMNKRYVLLIKYIWVLLKRKIDFIIFTIILFTEKLFTLLGVSLYTKQFFLEYYFDDFNFLIILYSFVTLSLYSQDILIWYIIQRITKKQRM